MHKVLKLIKVKYFALGLLTMSPIAYSQNAPYKLTYEYDAQGNITKIIDGLGNVTDQTYDQLNRPVIQAGPEIKVGAGRTTVVFNYDLLDQVSSIKDARGITTTYITDGIGTSPNTASSDSGSIVSTHDVLGNLLSRTDAKGQTTSYSYDKINRLTRIVYSDNSETLLTYDTGIGGVGKITQLSDPNEVIRYQYNLEGDILSEAHIRNGIEYITSYEYNNAGEMISLKYPGGRLVILRRDQNGRINQVESVANGNSVVLIKDVIYFPFGDVKSFINGAGILVSRTMDLSGRISGYTLSSSTHSLVRDAAARIIGITDSGDALLNQSFEYNGLGQLTKNIGPKDTQQINYDFAGNRTSKKLGLFSAPITYEANSNKILQVWGGKINRYQFDANGNTVSNGDANFTYDARNRMINAKKGDLNVNYRINALGQRIEKISNGIVTSFHYDNSGKLISESLGTLKKDYIYLGDVPIAIIQ